MVRKFTQRITILLVGLVTLLVVSCGSSDINSSEPVDSSSSATSQTTIDTRKMATVRGKVLLDNGEMVAAGIVIENEQGETYRTLTNIHSGYNIKLNAGTYKLHFTRGLEYSIVTKTITVEDYKMYYLQDVRLIHLEDPYAQGWIAGELHQHSYYSDGLNSASDVVISNLAGGLYYGFLTDHNTALGLAEWMQANRLVANVNGDGSERYFSAYDGLEVTTEFGHYQALGIGLAFDTYDVILREIERVKSAEIKEGIIKERVRYIGETIKWTGGVAQINHPYSSSTMGFRYWDVIDAFDTIEIWNGYFLPSDGRYEPLETSKQGQNYKSKLKWFELLNDVKNGGHFLAATGGTDNHDVSGPYKPSGHLDLNNIQTISEYEEAFLQYGKYNGLPTNYVKIDGQITQEKVLNALRNGHNFITNGPIVYADILGATYGETAFIDENGADITINLATFARDGVEGIRIVKNGEIVKTIENINEIRYEENILIKNIIADDWFVIEVLGLGAQYAITNPIFIQLAN